MTGGKYIFENTEYGCRFELAVEGGTAQLRTAGMASGARINGQPLAASTVLQSGDRIRFDVAEFVLRVKPDNDAAAETVIRDPGGPAGNCQAAEKKPVWVWPGEGDSRKTRIMTPEERDRLRAQDAASVDKYAESVGAPTLVVRAAGGIGVYQLNAEENGITEWTVGSDPGRDIRIEADGVSGLHAKIINAGSKWKVVDAVSSNGTRVKGKVVITAFLNTGDDIDFGPVHCVFRLPDVDGNTDTTRESRGLLERFRLRDRLRKLRQDSALIIGFVSFAVSLLLLLALATGVVWFMSRQ